MFGNIYLFSKNEMLFNFGEINIIVLVKNNVHKFFIVYFKII